MPLEDSFLPINLKISFKTKTDKLLGYCLRENLDSLSVLTFCKNIIFVFFLIIHFSYSVSYRNTYSKVLFKYFSNYYFGRRLRYLKKSREVIWLDAKRLPISNLLRTMIYLP